MALARSSFRVLPFSALAEADLAEKLPSANPELEKLYEQLTVDYLRKIDRSDFPGRVYKELVRLLPTGVSGKEQVAEALHVLSESDCSLEPPLVPPSCCAPASHGATLKKVA